jgi:hypothetical protein
MQLPAVLACTFVRVRTYNTFIRTYVREAAYIRFFRTCSTIRLLLATRKRSYLPQFFVDCNHSTCVGKLLTRAIHNFAAVMQLRGTWRGCCCSTPRAHTRGTKTGANPLPLKCCIPEVIWIDIIQAFQCKSNGCDPWRTQRDMCRGASARARVVCCSITPSRSSPTAVLSRIPAVIGEALATIFPMHLKRLQSMQN